MNDVTDFGKMPKTPLLLKVMVVALIIAFIVFMANLEFGTEENLQDSPSEINQKEKQ